MSNSYWCVGLLGGFVLLAGAATPGQPSTQEKAGAAAPKTSQECRQRVLEEIQRFRKLDRPALNLGGDEHIGRSIAVRFHACKTEARLALAYSGDEKAITELVREFDLDNANDEKWLAGQAMQYHGTQPLWSQNMMALVRALEAQRPKLAASTRQRLWRLWQKPDVPRADAQHPPLNRLSLEEIARAAQKEGDFDAMIEYARLDRARALPMLLKQMGDAKKAINVRFAAARAAARVGDMQALEWLKQAALENVGLGGWPGQALLEAGDEGARRFFQTVEDFQKKHPGEALPYALAEGASAGLDADLFVRHLPRLLEIKDARLHGSISSALSSRPLPVEQLTYLIEKLRKTQYKDTNLAWGIEQSLWWHGPANVQARQAVELWVDELHRSPAAGPWELGAKIFLRTRLGHPELAAAGARHHLATIPDLACRVLAETGKAQDAVAIWNALHQHKKEAHEDWYSRPALGWVATMRLTQAQLPAQSRDRP